MPLTIVSATKRKLRLSSVVAVHGALLAPTIGIDRFCAKAPGSEVLGDKFFPNCLASSVTSLCVVRTNAEEFVFRLIRSSAASCSQKMHRQTSAADPPLLREVRQGQFDAAITTK